MPLNTNPITTTPSARQQTVLRTIWNFIDRRGFPPSIRELGLSLDIHSTNGINDHLKALIRKGLLSKEPHRARSIRITEAGLRALQWR
jgi:repressor LexA